MMKLKYLKLAMCWECWDGYPNSNSFSLKKIAYWSVLAKKSPACLLGAPIEKNVRALSLWGNEARIRMEPGPLRRFPRSLARHPPFAPAAWKCMWEHFYGARKQHRTHTERASLAPGTHNNKCWLQLETQWSGCLAMRFSRPGHSGSKFWSRSHAAWCVQFANLYSQMIWRENTILSPMSFIFRIVNKFTSFLLVKKKIDIFVNWAWNELLFSDD